MTRRSVIETLAGIAQISIGALAICYGIGWFLVQLSIKSYFPANPDVPRESAIVAGILFMISLAPSTAYVYLKVVRKSVDHGLIWASIGVATLVVSQAIDSGILISRIQSPMITPFSGLICMVGLQLSLATLVNIIVRKRKGDKRKKRELQLEQESDDHEPPAEEVSVESMVKRIQELRNNLMVIGGIWVMNQLTFGTLVWNSLFFVPVHASQVDPNKNLSIVFLQKPTESLVGALLMNDANELVIRGAHSTKHDHMDVSSVIASAIERLENSKDFVENPLMSNVHRIPRERVVSIVDLTRAAQLGKNELLRRWLVTSGESKEDRSAQNKQSRETLGKAR